MMPQPFEVCAECAEPTGKAGEAEDSLIIGGRALCEGCYDAYLEEWRMTKPEALRFAASAIIKGREGNRTWAAGESRKTAKWLMRKADRMGAEE